MSCYPVFSNGRISNNTTSTDQSTKIASGEQKTYKLKKKSIVTVLLLFFNLKKKSMEEKKVLHLHSTLQCEFFKDKDMDENGVILLWENATTVVKKKAFACL